MRQADSTKIGRRGFLRTFAGGAGLAAASAASSATTAEADSNTNEEKHRSRYRETEHVKTYYRVNRYPTR